MRLYIKVVGEAGRSVVHRVNIAGGDDEALLFLDRWSALTKAGVVGVWDGSGRKIPFSKLPEPGANLSPRLILTFRVNAEGPRAVYARIAITDPLESVVRCLVEGAAEPEVWRAFREDAIPLLRTRGGKSFGRLTAASYSVKPRIADLDLPASVGAPYDDFIMIHADTHLSGGIDEISFSRELFIGASGLRAAGALGGTSGVFATWDLSPTGTSGVLGTLILDGYTKGDLEFAVLYAQIGTSAGDVVFRLQYRTFGIGDVTGVEYQIEDVFAPVLGEVIAERVYVIPEDRLLGSVGLAFRLDRLGGDTRDTQGNYTRIIGVRAKIVARLLHT